MHGWSWEGLWAARELQQQQYSDLLAQQLFM
jgi:hypothetical protein